MLNDVSSPSTEIHLSDIPFYDLHPFILIIHDKLDINCGEIKDLQSLFQVFVRFDRIPIARRVLYAVSRNLSGSELFDALVLASRLDDLPCAYRIMAQGWKSVEGGGEGPSLNPISRTRRWGPADTAIVGLGFDGGLYRLRFGGRGRS